MSRLDRLVSAIAPVIVRYIALKRSLGRRAETAGHVLAQLDRFLGRAVDLTRETFAVWCSSLEPLAPSTRRQRMRTVYHLCLFRRRSEPTCFVPDPSQFPLHQPRPRPHIFSEEEIKQLLLAADDLTSNALSPLHPQVCRLAVVLLYTTGLRRAEIVRLRLSDYDADECVLLVRDTKFYKSRLIPLSVDAAGEIDRYLEQRLQPGFPLDADSPLLLNNHGGLTGYTGPGFGHMMRKLFRAAGIRTSAGRSPRVHDLRFTFAVHALLRWYRAGVDVQVRLPALSVYMGHASIVSTQYYLTFVDAIAEAASERFHKHCSAFLPTGSFAGGVP